MPADPRHVPLGDVQVAAHVDAPVLVVGRTGRTRREIARQIHDHSVRHHGPWVAVPSHATDEALAASFRRASGGTIFISDVAEMPLRQRRRLLALLARQAQLRDDATWRSPRIIAGTAHDLEREIRARHFSRTLFYRLNVIRVDADGEPAARFRQES